jgi:hypothetical protein
MHPSCSDGPRYFTSQRGKINKEAMCTIWQTWHGWRMRIPKQHWDQGWRSRSSPKLTMSDIRQTDRLRLRLRLRLKFIENWLRLQLWSSEFCTKAKILRSFFVDELLLFVVLLQFVESSPCPGDLGRSTLGACLNIPISGESPETPVIFPSDGSHASPSYSLGILFVAKRELCQM